jgi:adenine C2-methylase RlmN of 23S rRNA A2503 and tRNA A37
MPTNITSEHFEITDIRERLRVTDEPVMEVLLQSKRIQHPKPIICSLYPRGGNSTGYTREISPQIGCHIGCGFCRCGNFKGDLNPAEVSDQVRILTEVAIERKIPAEGPYKTSFTDGGEILLNPNCMDILESVQSDPTTESIRVSTVLPNTPKAKNRLAAILNKIQTHAANIALQISMSSTSERIRQSLSRIPLFPDEEIRDIGELYKSCRKRRKKNHARFYINGRVSLCTGRNKRRPHPRTFRNKTSSL